MSHTAPVLLALLAVTVTASPRLEMVLMDATGLIRSEVMTVTGAVDKTALSVLSSQCNTLKKLLHKEYNKSSPPDLSKLTLNLYTRDVHIVYNLSDAAEVIPTSPYFKNERLIIIYFHGFLNNPSQATFQEINDAFLEKSDYNVLALDSSSYLGLSTLYVGATTNVRYIGEKLGAVLANMTKVGSKASSMYLIGHSLGAHIASFTGKTYTALTGGKVARITGLDPAGPCYTDIDSNMKLNSTDAEFVDVIHTNAGVFGLDEQIGHVDFYTNGGSQQPGCYTQVCDHNRAWMLYAESVLIQSMPAVSCYSWDDFKSGQCNTTDISVLGYSCDPQSRGRYYLRTAGTRPYGLGEEGLVYKNSDKFTTPASDIIGIIL